MMIKIVGPLTRDLIISVHGWGWVVNGMDTTACIISCAHQLICATAGEPHPLECLIPAGCARVPTKSVSQILAVISAWSYSQTLPSLRNVV